MSLEDAAATLTAPSTGATGSEATTAETTATSTVVEEQPTTPIEGAETAGAEAGETETAGEAEATKGEDTSEDGRVLPKWVRSLKETDPEGYKKAKTDFFDLRERRTDFPTVADARKAKQTLELVGGEAGLAEMQADNAEFSAISKKFLNADPQFAADLFEQDTIAAAQIVPHVLEQLQKYDGQAYNRLIAKQFAQEFSARAINGGTIRAALERAYAAAPLGEAGQAIRDELNAIALWQDKVTQLAKQEENPEVKKLREKIKADEQARANEGQKQFVTAYRDEAQKMVRDSATNLVTQFLGTRKLDAESKNLAVHNTISLANDLLNDGKTFPQFAKQRDMLFQRGDKPALLRYVSSAWKQALDMSVKRVMRLVGGGGTAPAPKAAAPAGTRPAAAAAPGFVKINERPDPRMIDRTKTTANMIASEKKAVLKDGKKVTWAHL